MAVTLGIAESIGVCLPKPPTGELAPNLKLSHQKYSWAMPQSGNSCEVPVQSLCLCFCHNIENLFHVLIFTPPPPLPKSTRGFKATKIPVKTLVIKKRATLICRPLPSCCYLCFKTSLGAQVFLARSLS